MTILAMPQQRGLFEEYSKVAEITGSNKPTNSKTPQRNRPAMTGYYKEETKTLLFGGRCLLYQINTTKNDNWYCRIRLPLKTSSKAVALGEVEILYRTMLHRSQLGLSTKDISWDTLFEEWKNHRYKISKRGHTWIRRAEAKNKLVFRHFFSNTDNLPSIALIKELHISKYISWRLDLPEARKDPKQQKLGWKTLSMELIVLKNILKFAHTQGYIPIVPNVDHPAKRPPREELQRAKYDKGHYQRLMKLLLQEQKTGYDKRTRRNAIALRLAVKLTASSGIRQRELRKLRFKDITSKQDEDGYSFTIININPHIAKTTIGRNSVCLDGSNCFDMLLKWREIANWNTDEDLIFAKDNDRNTSRQLWNQYDCVVARYIDHSDPNKRLYKHDALGRSFTLSSLRHYYINTMIENGTDIAVICEQVGTSLTQISNNYSYNRSWKNRLALTTQNYRRRVLGVD